MPQRRLAKSLAVAATFLLVTLLPHTAGADTEAEQERDRVRQQQGESAANVDALEAEQGEVEAAIAQLDQQVATEQAALDSAERAVAEAEDDQARAEEGIAEAEDELAQLEDQLRAQMVEHFTGVDEGPLAVLDAQSATDMVKRRAILDGRAAEDDDLVDQVVAAQVELQAQRQAAREAEERAEAQRQEVAERLDSVQAARDQQASFAADVQQRIDTELARAVELAAQDRALSAQIAREQARLQARLAYVAAAEQAQQDAADRAAAAASTASYDSDGREPSGPVADPRPPTGGGGGVTQSGGGMCNAAGITVACSIAGNVAAMINAAASSGVSLSGSGYRDPSRQIALRQAHCGSSHYAIYEMPSSQCSPPTARPGSSQHEVGLAIDFNNCSSRGTACFRWLSANAASFGMYNLPSEPWHWSVNGS